VAGIICNEGLVNVSQNVVDCGLPEHRYGILVEYTTGSKLFDNNVTLGGGIVALALIGEVHNCTVMQNKLVGSGAYATGIHTEGNVATGNVFMANNTGPFTSYAADYLFYPVCINNTVVGESGSVIDPVPPNDNTITGLTNKHGQQVSDAVQKAITDKKDR
jgi:hypothetical protein